MKRIFGSEQGMTFMELMITVVIIGIVAAMAVPRFQKAIEKARFQGANRQIMSTLRLARSNAIADKAQYGVFFDQNALTVTLFKDVVNLSSYSLEMGDSILRVDTLPIGFIYLDSDDLDDSFVFRPNGSAKFDGTGFIATIASTYDVLAIATYNVLASTGRIKTTGEWYYYY